MLKQAVPIPEWLTDTEAAGALIDSLATRLTDGADHTIPEGRRALSINVRTAVDDDSPVFTTTGGSVVLPEGASIALSCDFPADQLAEMSVTTVDGDDVLVIETFVVP